MHCASIVILKIFRTGCLLAFLFALPVNAMAADFITTWKTDNPGDSADNQITIPTNLGGYDYEIDWGDGTSDVGVAGSITHTYAVPGTYTVNIRGDFPRFFFDNVGDPQKLLSVDQWGDIEWDAMNRAFHGAINMVINATDAPDLSNVINMNLMFQNTTFNDPINHWDVSNVTLMSSLFADSVNFNQDLSSWDTGNVTAMNNMFLRAESFNGNITTWDTSSVNNMLNMFNSATNFNQDISFKPATGAWNVSNVDSLRGVFFRASSFNQDISNWDVSMVESMQSTFQEASSFNQDLNDWDTSNVTSMFNMFFRANAFNGDISQWDTSMVNTMRFMFAEAFAFNQDISFKPATGAWDTGMVLDMRNMFQDASVFDQPIGNWDTSLVENMQNMFQNAITFNQDLNDWETGNVALMQQMFWGASTFDGDISDWDTAMVVNMNNMFRDTPFNQDISGWDTGLVENMTNMFRDATAFDQDLGNWDVTSLLLATNMFRGATLSTDNYDSLLIGWDMQDLENGVGFHGGFSQYCLGESARDNMTDPGGADWNIVDGGLSCPNAAPTDIQIDLANTDSVDENAASGTTVGALTTIDADTDDTHTYSLACDTAGADDSLFQISGSNLQTNAVFDFEAPSDANTDGTYEVCIRTTDDGDPAESYDEVITISINNQPPNLVLDKQTSEEEPLVGQTITFTISVSNLGPDIATAVSILDVVPAGFSYVSGSIEGGDTNDDSSPAGTGLNWVINSLTSTAPAIDLTFDAIVNAP